MARYCFSGPAADSKSQARGLYQQYFRIADDPRRERYAYARKCAFRRWAWLRERIPIHDWDQTVSLACCGNETKVALARRVDNEFYALARAECFCRPSRNLRRGASGKWIAVEREVDQRRAEQHIENPSPEGLYNTIIDRRISC